jgi:hypothetical protein
MGLKVGDGSSFGVLLAQRVRGIPLYRTSNNVEVRAGSVVFVFAIGQPWRTWLCRPLPHPVYCVCRIFLQVTGDENVGLTSLFVNRSRLARDRVGEFILTRDGDVATVYLITSPVVKVLSSQQSP